LRVNAVSDIQVTHSRVLKKQERNAITRMSRNINRRAPKTLQNLTTHAD
jgi:hypothetical protein